MRKALRFFSKVITAPASSPNEMVGAELVEGLNEYSRAIDLINSKEWDKAESELNLCLDIALKAGQYGDPSYNFILTRIALVQRAQRKFLECEKTLEQIVYHSLNISSKYPDLLEKSYDTLYKQYLSTNIIKALKLGEYLLSQPNFSLFSPMFQREIRFFFGVIFIQTALVLHGQHFLRAKDEFDQCIKMNPGPNSCFVYHNMACAQWLHMRQFINNSPDTTMDIEKEKALVDFIECIPNFQKAVQLFEGFPEYYSVESGLNLKNKLSGLPMTNIAEIYFEKLEVDVSVMQNGVKWLNAALKLYEEYDRNNIGRVLTLIGMFFNSKGNEVKAMSILKSAVEILKSVQDIQKYDYNEIFAMNVYGNLLKKIKNREAEGNEICEKARQIAVEIPEWYKNSVYLYVPEWSI